MAAKYGSELELAPVPGPGLGGNCRLECGCGPSGTGTETGHWKGAVVGGVYQAEFAELMLPPAPVAAWTGS